MIFEYEPGDKVINPLNKDWGIGQVQSIIKDKVTVNFQNAVTAAYFADADYNVMRVNQNFKQFFPSLSNPQGVYFPKVLEALNVENQFIEEFMEQFIESFIG